VSRQLSQLYAYGLFARMGKRRYKLTNKGRTIIMALLAAALSDVEQLARLAA
jgi:predicted transcriptional regulator